MRISFLKKGLLRRCVLLSCIFFGIEAIAPAQSILEQANPDYLCKTWQTEDGLPFPIVRSVIQTHDGYICVGTQEGIYRFDGVEFTPVREGLSSKIRNRSYVPLLESHDGSLWYSDLESGMVSLKDGQVRVLPV